MRRAQREQIESAILHFPDFDGTSGYFAEGPELDIAIAEMVIAGRGNSKECPTPSLSLNINAFIIEQPSTLSPLEAA